MSNEPGETLRVANDAPAQPHDAPREIAGYDIVALVGEGGMGRVYRARERHPARDVALKLVRGIGRESLARFRREATTLATLEHPNIARLYAAGETSFGGVALPWLAMEFVDGVDLARHVRDRALPITERIRLLVEICRAVHYAHGRGVIHRDLKPGNILVDADGRPRILDFGIARLVADGDAMTEAGQVLGTLPYMSPEQLSGRSRDVDVRSDVYALGVIAYELVAGRLPHPRLSTSSLLEALELVRRETPPALAAIEPKARGDLDLVVMKALAQEPDRRYATAADFAQDLERVLTHRPVEARAPTLGYRAARFARRHRALTAATLLVLATLIAASVVSIRYAIAEAGARREAEQRAAEARSANDFLAGMLSAADPEQARGRNVTVSEVLDAAEAELRTREVDPAVRSSLLATLSRTRASLGDYARAITLADDALKLGVAEPLAKSRVLHQRAVAQVELGQFDEARRSLADSRGALGSVPAGADRRAVQFALALSDARVDQEQGRNEPSEAAQRRLVAEIEALPEAERAQPAIADTLDTARSNLSALLRDRGALDEALALNLAVYESRRAQRGERDPRTLASRHKLALVHAAQGDHAKAIEASRATLALQREVLGDTHASTLTTMQTLANSLLASGALDESEALTREALAGWTALVGEAHAQTIASMNALAYLLEERQRPEEAEPLYRRILALTPDGEKHPENLGTRNNLAMLLMNDGRHADALREFEFLLASAEKLVGRDHPYFAIFSSNYGLCLAKAGDVAKARAVLTDAHEKLVAIFGADHPRTKTAAERLAALPQP